MPGQTNGRMAGARSLLPGLNDDTPTGGLKGMLRRRFLSPIGTTLTHRSAVPSGGLRGRRSPKELSGSQGKRARWREICFRPRRTNDDQD
jgi:hypothetical protein